MSSPETRCAINLIAVCLEQREKELTSCSAIAASGGSRRSDIFECESRIVAIEFCRRLVSFDASPTAIVGETAHSCARQRAIGFNVVLCGGVPNCLWRGRHNFGVYKNGSNSINFIAGKLQSISPLAMVDLQRMPRHQIARHLHGLCPVFFSFFLESVRAPTRNNTYIKIVQGCCNQNVYGCELPFAGQFVVPL